MTANIERKTCRAADQLLDYRITPEEGRERARIFESDDAGALKQMVGTLFHEDADPVLVADAEKRMAGTSPAAAREMFLSIGGYDGGAAVRRLTAPLRAINGDLYPTDTAALTLAMSSAIVSGV